MSALVEIARHRGADAPSTAGFNGNNEVENEGTSLIVDWTINDAWTLRSLSAYREDYTESVIDFDSLDVVLGQLVGGVGVTAFTGVVLRDSLPRNPNGMILKRELRAEYVRP